MNSTESPVEYLHDQPSDRWWRRFGLWLYLGVCALSMALVPGGSGAPAWSIRAIDWLPSLRGLLAGSPGEGRIVAWVLASVLAYPLMHRAMRARVYRQPRGPYWKVLLAILVMDIVLLGPLWLDLVSMRGNRLTRLVRDALLSDGVAMIFMASVISALYAFVLFVNLQVWLTAFSDPDKEK